MNTKIVRVFLGLSIVLSMSGCATVNPVVAQLDQYQQWKSSDQLAEIIAHPVTDACKNPKDGCARLYALRAEALAAASMRNRANNAVCPATSEARNLNAAAADYAKHFELANPAGTAQDEQILRSNYVLTLYCLAESAETIGAGLELARKVDDSAQKLPAPSSLLWRSRAQLYLARPGGGDNAAMCRAARNAHEFAAQGLASNPDENSAAILERLIRDADQRRRQINGCEA
jgi:hypothetical protein